MVMRRSHPDDPQQTCLVCCSFTPHFSYDTRSSKITGRPLRSRRTGRNGNVECVGRMIAVYSIRPKKYRRRKSMSYCFASAVPFRCRRNMRLANTWDMMWATRTSLNFSVRREVDKRGGGSQARCVYVTHVLRRQPYAEHRPVGKSYQIVVVDREDKQFLIGKTCEKQFWRQNFRNDTRCWRRQETKKRGKQQVKIPTSSHFRSTAVQLNRGEVKRAHGIYACMQSCEGT